MRTFADRLRHTLIFEALALLIVMICGSWITGHSMEMVGALGLMFSLLAMSWNFVFNLLFDLWERAWRATAKRGFWLRAVHAILFELGILIAGIFLVAWWLEMTLLEALILDVGMSAFFLVYAFAFNWTYDLMFPIPSKTAPAARFDSIG